MAVAVDIKALLEAGVHFGHKTSRWHPKMAPYIHSKRQDSHIIDLTKTVEGLEKALPVITKTVAGGKQVLFVGTKKQAKDIVKAAAEKAGQPYVTERWVGGMLTNVATTSAQIKKLKDQLDARRAVRDDYYDERSTAREETKEWLKVVPLILAAFCGGALLARR